MIRPAVPTDAGAILAILNPIIAETTITFAADPAAVADVEAGLAAHAERGDPYLVAEQDGRVVGFAKYGPFRGGSGYARIAELTVHLAPDARGRAIGPALVTALEQNARDAGKHSLIAGISAENVNALNFHKKLGYRQVGRIPEAGFKFGRFIDLVLMQKFL